MTTTSPGFRGVGMRLRWRGAGAGRGGAVMPSRERG
jgi:hypothetical protein